MIKSPFMEQPWKSVKRIFWISLVMAAAILLLHRSDIEAGDLTQRVHGFTRAVEFDYGKWGLQALGIKSLQVGSGAVDYLPEEAQKELVLAYLDLVRTYPELLSVRRFGSLSRRSSCIAA